MKLHPFALEARALAAHRRRVGTGNNDLSATYEESGTRCYVAVRESGMAVAAYVVQRNQLRWAELKRLPEPVW